MFTSFLQKEKDLELTARIGKELLTHNNKLETNVANLEAELKAANDKIEQITHELAKKTELIQVVFVILFYLICFVRLITDCSVNPLGAYK